MKILVKLFILTILILCIFSCFSDFNSKEHSKDEKLIENFQTHKADFEQLVQMFQEDKSLGRVAFDFTRTSNFFEKCEEPNGWNGKEIEASSERLAEYRKLFDKVSLSAGIEGYCKKDRILFYASTKGLSVTGSTKGYAYLQKVPEGLEKLVDNLDTYWSPNGKSFTAFRHIEENWYLYFDYED